MKRTRPVSEVCGGLQRVLVQTEVAPSPIGIDGQPVVHRFWRYLDGFARCEQEVGCKPVLRSSDFGQPVPALTARQRDQAALVLLTQVCAAVAPSPQQTFVWDMALNELWLQETDEAVLAPIRAALAQF